MYRRERIVGKYKKKQIFTGNEIKEASILSYITRGKNSLLKKELYIVKPEATCHITRQASIIAHHKFQTINFGDLKLRDLAKL